VNKDTRAMLFPFNKIWSSLICVIVPSGLVSLFNTRVSTRQIFRSINNKLTTR